MIRGSNPGDGRFFAPVPTGPSAHPASCTMSIKSLPQGHCGWGVVLTAYPIQGRYYRKSADITPFFLWTFMASSRVNVYLYVNRFYKINDYKLSKKDSFSDCSMVCVFSVSQTPSIEGLFTKRL
jgi:hypothetical protein